MELKVYPIEYDEKMENDVQDVFIESLLEGAERVTIEIIDEENRRYVIDIKMRTVKKN
ncbi:MAG: hypothetical protein JKY01_10345 [Pseudomonadales bacterium]|nr:hypothetical protein [Pseudomonadales bacterium]